MTKFNTDSTDLTIQHGARNYVVTLEDTVWRVNKRGIYTRVKGSTADTVLSRATARRQLAAAKQAPKTREDFMARMAALDLPEDVFTPAKLEEMWQSTVASNRITGVLEAHGLEVNITRTGLPPVGWILTVTGDTIGYKVLLKSVGLRWDPARGAWWTNCTNKPGLGPQSYALRSKLAALLTAMDAAKAKKAAK